MAPLFEALNNRFCGNCKTPLELTREWCRGENSSYRLYECPSCHRLVKVARVFAEALTS